MSVTLEQQIAAKGVDPVTAAEIRAFERFLGRVGRPPVVVASLDHWDQAYIAGGPHPPHRWEGDDS